MTTILIGGDICPTTNNIKYFISGNEKEIFNDVLNDIKKADFVLANLECPLINNPTPILKSGAHFGASPEAINAIKNAGINYLNLANNHILDHGKEGLSTTLETLNKYNIFYSGAGFNKNEASKPFVKTINNITISILTYTEHEHSIATNDSAGSNPLCIIDFSKKIHQLRKNSDFILLLYHGGKEYYLYPTPNQKHLAEFFIDMGVDMVVCQHSHVPGVIQNYKNGVIFYGQGNFVFDPVPHSNQNLYKGFLIEVNIKTSSLFHYRLIPFYHNSLKNKQSTGISKMIEEESQTFINDLLNLSSQLSDEKVQMEWEQLCKKHEALYLSILKGHNRIMRKLFTKTFLFKTLYSNKSKQALIKNLISCETHREILLTILKQKMKC